MRNDLKPENRIYENNEGSTLITVIVAIAFVTILVSIILGTSAVNVRMKGIDRRTKDDFYYAERSLNDIYTGIGQELAVKAGDQYEKSFKKVGTVDGEGDFNMAENAEKDFRKKFMGDAYTWIDGLTASDLEQFIQDASKGHVIWNGDVEYQKKDGSNTSSPEEAYRVVLQKVQVYVEDASHFRSTISTDIVVTLPTVDFLGTNADVSDYGLIANEGLYIEGRADIKGNVYAGVHATANSQDATYSERTDEFSKNPVFGGINIKDGKASFDGNYIISKGDINLAGTNPQLKVYSTAAGAAGNLANLWYTSMRTVSGASIDPLPSPIPSPLTEPTIDINANVFALNDLALNADNSSVIVKGNYYGYNEGGLSNILGKKDGRDDAANSAIIVNGSKAYLDMRDINNFVLMGKAYIDFTSDNDTNPAATATQVVPTAESVALKTNQQLYLVPIDFLDGANPIEVAGGSHTFNINVSVTDLQRWFGYDYVDKSTWTDSTKAPESMHKDYKVTLKAFAGGTDVWYDYLMFDDSVNWKPEEVTAPGTDTANEKYITKKNSDGTYTFLKYTRSTSDLGTGGSISSKAMFFLKIMMSDSAYEYAYDHKASDPDLVARSMTSKTDFVEYKESAKVQPSEYRLYKRIDDSMKYDYFSLRQCVVGNSTAPSEAHYYAKNAVINYERDASDKIQSNVLNNTDGMGRYAGYTQNLFRRYVFLCTKLDGKETKLLDASPETNAAEWTKAEGEWGITSTTPLSHFINIANIDSMNIGESLTSTSTPPKTCANGEGLKPGAFGVVIATNGPLTIDTTLPTGVITANTFKGVAIVKGDIIVASGINVDGLLMATGTITLKGNNDINYDKGLIQSRIEKEMNLVKNKADSTSDTYKGKKGYMNYYTISYLSKDDTGTPKLIYDVEAGTKIKQDRIEADYNDFMHYENWKKGEE